MQNGCVLVDNRIHVQGTVDSDWNFDDKFACMPCRVRAAAFVMDLKRGAFPSAKP